MWEIWRNNVENMKKYERIRDYILLYTWAVRLGKIPRPPALGGSKFMGLGSTPEKGHET